jgi:predicted ArsR family transcriptional regulator
MPDSADPAVPLGPDFDAQVNGIAALGEPTRRAVYRYVAAHAGPVNRDQAASGAGVPRHVAKFHLDRLVEDGLLEVEYARPGGRGGPGAGRPAKLYRRSSHEISVSLPARHYELAGRLLARAVTQAGRDGTAVGDALRQAAGDSGRALGQQARQRAGKHPDESALLAATLHELGENGFEPRADPTGVTLANCPFHALAQDYTELVCGMNLDLMTGLIDGLQPTGFHARLDPAPGRCCVRLARTGIQPRDAH